MSNASAWRVDPASPEYRSTLADPPRGGYNITAAMVSDTVDLATPIRGFETTAAGDVAVIGADDVPFILKARQANTRTSCMIKRILVTGTTEALRTNAGASTPLIGLV